MFAAPRIGRELLRAAPTRRVPRSVRSRAREVERAFSDLEHSLGRSPNDDELAAHLRIDGTELAQWLASIATTTIGPLDRRRRRIRAGGEYPGWGWTPQSPRSKTAAADIMRAEIKRLPEREKLALSLYYDEGLALAEIGQVLK